MKRESKNLILEQLKKTPIIQIACEKSGVSRATYYRWRKEDQEFLKAADEAIRDGEALITDMSESQLISLIRDRNFPAIQLWLKHHHPSYTNRLEISGRIEHLRQELTEEEKQLVERALRLAMPAPKEELEEQINNQQNKQENGEQSNQQ